MKGAGVTVGQVGLVSRWVGGYVAQGWVDLLVDRRFMDQWVSKQMDRPTGQWMSKQTDRPMGQWAK